MFEVGYPDQVEVESLPAVNQSVWLLTHESDIEEQPIASWRQK